MRFLTILTSATVAHAMAFAPHVAVAQSAASTKPAPAAAPSAKPTPSAAAPSAAASSAAAPSAKPTPSAAAPSAAASSAAAPSAAAPSTPAPKVDAASTPTAGTPTASATQSAVSPEDAKLACIASFDEAQRERNAGHFLASRAALIQCSEQQCGDALASECTRMFSDVEAATPSVVFSAHDAALNADRSDVAVAMNGKPFLERLDGKPLPLDPGQYEFTFSAPGAQSVKLPVVIRTGEKYRVINVVFPAPEAPKATLQAPAAALAAAPPEASGGVPALSYVFGGLGVAGVGAFVALRLIGASDYKAMEDTCAPTCLDSDIDNLKLKYLLSNVALGVGAASLGAAIVIYAVAPSEPEAPAASVALVPTAGGSSLVFDARF